MKFIEAKAFCEEKFHKTRQVERVMRWRSHLRRALRVEGLTQYYEIYRSKTKKSGSCQTPIYITLSVRRNSSKQGKASEEDEDVVAYVESTESQL